ncbi:amino acid ABC transporter [Ciceribacter naphthalenivorans]|uniref:Amino acid ABC transporter n=2 Tax=Alphaproteobacteria TaxID=28211 RepID=A0A512HDM1_9HYPH|nr:transporter substrate-binding domain-containing protein [Sphingomonas psychrolutea]GEO83545.1 amino acid ABC transporter [Ciceribacter naphthalenivorans]GLR24304.1 amino acid ABC transporter [Ciceribacter naphthalenivorans]GLT07160.1 amino acid ABC transporter [Sphingomonas psychrolutea]
MLFDARERLPRPDLTSLLRLRFLTTTDFPPFNFADQTGRLAGFHVELARAICAELRIEAKCQIQALPYTELEAALDSGQGDAVLAGVAVTEELRDRFLFSRPYMLLPARFARNKEAVLGGQNADALFGRPVGVVSGTAHEAMLKAFFPDIQPVGFADRDAMLADLKAKKIDAVFTDSLRLSFWTAGEASGGCCALFGEAYVSERFLGEGLTIMVRQDDSTLVAAFDSALAALSRNGQLQEIYLSYFPYDLFR